MRAEEVNNAIDRAPDLTAEQKEVITIMFERIVRRILREPTTRLRAITRDGEFGKVQECVDAVRELFLA
ncbi:MAG: hypothetical protein M1368_03650 [Thaumarchaeota archaeon]|nr:hypothetical protein [Nitrososphaerota archaeon]